MQNRKSSENVEKTNISKTKEKSLNPSQTRSNQHFGSFIRDIQKELTNLSNRNSIAKKQNIISLTEHKSSDEHGVTQESNKEKTNTKIQQLLQSSVELKKKINDLEITKNIDKQKPNTRSNNNLSEQYEYFNQQITKIKRNNAITKENSSLDIKKHLENKKIFEKNVPNLKKSLDMPLAQSENSAQKKFSAQILQKKLDDYKKNLAISSLDDGVNKQINKMQKQYYCSSVKNSNSPYTFFSSKFKPKQVEEGDLQKPKKVDENDLQKYIVSSKQNYFVEELRKYQKPLINYTKTQSNNSLYSSNSATYNSTNQFRNLTVQQSSSFIHKINNSYLSPRTEQNSVNNVVQSQELQPQMSHKENDIFIDNQSIVIYKQIQNDKVFNLENIVKRTQQILENYKSREEEWNREKVTLTKQLEEANNMIEEQREMLVPKAVEEKEVIVQLDSYRMIAPIEEKEEVIEINNYSFDS